MTVKRHPEDPDELPATYAWRQIVMSIIDDKENDWTRTSLAKASKTSPSQILKLLNGSTKSSAIVRHINTILEIPFIEPLPVSKEYAEIVEMIMLVEDVHWLRQTISLITQKKD